MSTAPSRIGDANVYLNVYLAPFRPWLDREDVTEILINKPHEIWIESSAAPAMEKIMLPAIDDRHLQRLAEQVARVSFQAISRDRPLLSATLPGGARAQFIAPSATRGHWAMAIRCHRAVRLPLSAYDRGPLPPLKAVDTLDPQVDPIGFLKDAVHRRQTILISGGTSSGKTTFLNALLAEIDLAERIVLVEDTPEIRLDHENVVGLVATKGDQGEAKITTELLLEAALRIRPDRIVLGELRGSEAVSFLRAINTGHPGSFSTIHANSPEGALDQLALMVMQAGLGLGRNETIDYTASVVDIIVQLEKSKGRRGIASILETRCLRAAA